MSRKSQCAFVGMILLSLVLPTTSAKAAAIIDVGEILLNANSKNEWAIISVSGGDSVRLLDFFAQVGDGKSGPRMLRDDGTGPVPGIDLVSGIFNVNNFGQTEIPLTLPTGTSKDFILGFNIFRNDDFRTPEVLANGPLAKIYFDTTGLYAGTWDFRLTDVAASTPGTGRTTQLVDYNSGDFVDLTIYNGTITVIPEPSSLLLALSGLGLAGAVYASRRRASRARG